MARIPVHSAQTAAVRSREALAPLEATYGRVLNVHGEMAHSPAVLNGYVALQDTIGAHGTFDARTRQAIALAAGPSTAAPTARPPRPVVRSVRVSTRCSPSVAGIPGLPDALWALVAITRAFTANTGTGADALWDSGAAAGWSDAELDETSIRVTVNLLSNYFNHVVRSELDFPPPTIDQP